MKKTVTLASVVPQRFTGTEPLTVNRCMVREFFSSGDRITVTLVGGYEIVLRPEEELTAASLAELCGICSDRTTKRVRCNWRKRWEAAAGSSILQQSVVLRWCPPKLVRLSASA